jgi:FAD/FMN-containing dehydrogenase
MTVERLAAIVGAAHISTDADVLASRCVDWTGRYRGTASVLVRPGDAGELASVLTACRDAGVCVTVQGGRTSLVAGTVPEHDDVLLSTERLTDIGPVDRRERQVRVGAGVTLAQLQRIAASAELLFGVDLAARESATIGGMAATNAGGLRTVRYGAMREQVLGLDVALPDGSVVHRHSRVRLDNTGYDLASLFVGAEGTLGVITAVDLALQPIPAHRVTAVCGFDELADLVATGRALRDIDTVSACELIDGRGARLATEHLAQPAPVPGDWLLLVELAGDDDPTERLATALSTAPMCGPPAVGVDGATQQRLWQLRESMAEVMGLFGPPLKFDVSLPLSSIAPFTAEACTLVGQNAPNATPVLFGHVGEGNLHLNVLGCAADDEARIYGPMMNLIAAHGGNVSSEHGVGSRKRAYLGMSREAPDIAVMRSIKAALDPTGYLNPAVLFDRSDRSGTSPR